MFEVIDKELIMSVLNLENQPNTYYISYQVDSKCVIDTLEQDNDIIIMPDPRDRCTAEELTIILDRFSNYLFTKKPNINGLLLKTEENYMLDSIGFKLLNEDSEYLYKENNKKINKVR